VKIERPDIRETSLRASRRQIDDLFVSRAAEPRIARLWTGSLYGDPTVYEPQGDYYVPFTLVVTLP
jgi:hypothetical protein